MKRTGVAAWGLCAFACAQGAPPSGAQRASPTASQGAAPSAAPATPGPTAKSSASASPPAPAAAPPTARATPGTQPPQLVCPTEMALVVRAQGAYCVDRYEATIALRAADGRETPHPGNQRVDGLESQIVARSLPGKKPQGYISGKQAAVACERAGKRLCENDEWVTACRGPSRSVYPYGDKRRKDICNDRFRVLDKHPVVRLFKKHAPPDEDEIKMWHPSWMNDPRLHEMTHSVVPTGAFKQCTNDYGVFDMVGNLHEWVADPDGVFFGGYLMDTYQNGEGCDYRTIFHPFDYHDYSTGFRCCADAKPGD